MVFSLKSEEALSAIIAHAVASALVRIWSGDRLQNNLLFLGSLFNTPIRYVLNFLHLRVQHVQTPLHVDLSHFLLVEVPRLWMVLNDVFVLDTKITVL